MPVKIFQAQSIQNKQLQQMYILQQSLQWAWHKQKKICHKTFSKSVFTKFYQRELKNLCHSYKKEHSNNFIKTVFMLHESYQQAKF